MAKRTFTATPTPAGKTGALASVDIPDDVLAALGGKRVPVKVTANGFTFRTTTAVMGGRQLVGFNTANMSATGVTAGTPVEITIENDEGPRVIEPPPELTAAFRTQPAAKRTWDTLSYTNQRQYAEWIAGAKKTETREQRLVKAIERLAAGERSFR